ncbi:MAG: hypothetical protein HN404_15745 [Gemmatimonadetes bacterium]|jgi:pimeloyl-ACP methyl ester carboxylesterase|nr:hypothetical protein [Gemmatimonadota bacterium]
MSSERRQLSPPRPIKPQRDLRTMVTDHLQGRSLDLLDEAASRRRAAFEDGRWEEYRREIRDHVSGSFGDMPFGHQGGPLQTRAVSTHDLTCCHVENVLFDSFPGWQVNASVFVPRGDGPFPAVVIPVGHSGKQFDNYQIPARAFASAGYLAVLFDPPGQASEKQTGNDHFVDGVRTFLTGYSANRYFVLDALRCIDYLETRDDADLSRGVGMTGVSGGGHTTLFSTLFDDRITCQGPSCCINRMADHPVGDLYSPCPEAKWSGRIRAGVDELDVLLAGIPVPSLYMAGRRDEVFQIDWSRALAGEAAEYFRLANAESHFAFFEDDAGHAYTLAQVRQFIAWMNRWILHEPDRPVPELDVSDFPMMPYEQLKCHPTPEQNMFTLNRSIAESQTAMRPARRTTEELGTLVGHVVGEAAGAPTQVTHWQQSSPFQVWSQTSREVLATVQDLEIPATWLEPIPEFHQPSSPVVLFIDDRGRRAALESWAPPARLSRMLQRDPAVIYPSMLVPDLPGWGETTPALVPYAMAGWGSMDRLTAYLSCTLGDGILAIRTRCAAALVRHLIDERGVAANRIILVGHGLGGAVALMAAAVAGLSLGAVVSWSGLLSFQCLTQATEYDWPACAFLPDVLPHFDLPDLVRNLPMPVAVFNPLDAQHRAIESSQAEAILAQLPPSVSLLTDCTDTDVISRLQDLMANVTERPLAVSDSLCGYEAPVLRSPTQKPRSEGRLKSG